MAAMKIDISEVVNGAIEKIKQEGYTVQKWIPCSERLPENDKDVLVYAIRKDGIDEPITTITQYRDYIWFGHKIESEPYWKNPWQYFSLNYEITHWMPLPEPPEKE